MKILVAYYSRTGNTAKIAREIAKELKCNIEEIHDTKNRAGILRWLMAGRDGSLKKTTVIKKTIYDPKDYDLVVIGTPIWVNTTPAIRTYLKKNAGGFKKAAFFCTMGGSSGQKTFTEMAEIAGIKPIATLDLRDKDIKKDNYQNNLRKFLAQIK